MMKKIKIFLMKVFIIYWNIRYVIEIPIQNFGLDLGLSQLNHSVEDYDELLNNLKIKLTKQ